MHSPSILIADTESRIMLMNPAAERLTGWTAEESLGRPIQRVLHLIDTRNRRQFEDVVVRVLHGRSRIDLVNHTALATRDGREVPVECSASPVIDTAGQLMGVVLVLHNLTVRKQVEVTQEFLVQCACQKPGENFFQALARHLGLSLGMDYVCIDRLEGDALLAQTVAIFCDGEFQDNVVYALKDTPCGDVVGKTICCFPAQVRNLFPRDAVLQQMKAESYVGTTLWGHDGRPIGLIAVIGRKPLQDPDLAQTLLRSVAQRTASELERSRAEETLRLTLKESQQRQSEVAALLKGARSVITHTEFLPAARAIFDSCKALTGASAGYIALLAHNKQEYELLFLDSGGAECSLDPSLPMPVRGLRAEAYRARKAVYDNTFARGAHARLIPNGHMALENVLFAPLLLGDEAVGLLGLANKPGGFTENDAQLASAFAELAAVALHNSQNIELRRDSEERFRLVAQSAVDAIMTVDAAGHVVFWNNAAERVFGYSSAEILGQPLLRLVPDRFRAEHERAFARAFSSGALEPGRHPRETIGLRKDGTEVPIELTMAICQRGRAVFCTAIVRDITERKQAREALQRAHDELELRVQERTRELAETVSRLETEVAARLRIEAELREAEERYRTLFAAAPVGIVLTDDSGLLYDANAALCEMFGLTLAEAQTANANSFYAKGDDRRRLMSRVRQENRVEGFETVLKRKDAAEFPAECHPIRRGPTAPTKIHDRRDHISGANPHHVVTRHRFRCHEKDCCSDDRRNIHFVPA